MQKNQSQTLKTSQTSQTKHKQNAQEPQEPQNPQQQSSHHPQSQTSQTSQTKHKQNAQEPQKLQKPQNTQEPQEPQNPQYPTTSQHPTILQPPKITPKSYDRLKRQVIHTEQDNFDSLYIVPCAGNKGWHEIGDHSALIYYYDILKDHLKKPKFIYDSFNGYYNHYEFGRISIRAIDQIIHNLDSAHIKYVITTLDHTGHHTTSPIHITRIKLSTTYPGNKIEQFIKAEKSRREKALQVPHADDLMPGLYLNLINFAAILHHLVNRNFNTLSRSVLAHTLLTQTNNIVRCYYEIAHIVSIIDEWKIAPQNKFPNNSPDTIPQNKYSNNSPNTISQNKFPNNNSNTIPQNAKNDAKYHLALSKILNKYAYIRKELDNLHVSIQMAHALNYIDVENCCIMVDTLTSIKEQVLKSIQIIAKKEIKK